MQTITSRDNAHIKTFRALAAQKKERERTGLFACEGARLCADALRSGLIPEEAFITEKALVSYPEAASALLDAAAFARILTPELSGWISNTGNPQGIFAVFKKLDNAPLNVKIVKGGKYLLLAGLQDPGNLGAVIRTAEAFGIAGVFIDEACPDLYAPKVLRASMGGVFRVPCGRADIPSAVGLLRESGVSVYAAALMEAARPLTRHLFQGSSAVLIGNEGAGLSASLIGLCDAAVTIPMAGGAQSLNAAAAAAVLLWEMANSK